MRFFFVTCFFFWTFNCWAEPTIIYIGKKDDNMYNQSLHLGIQEFEKKQGIKCIEREADNSSEYITIVKECIKQKHSPIIISDGGKRTEIINIIKNNPETFFIFLDSEKTQLTNATNITFLEQEGAFLAGALAGMMSRTNVIGFIYASKEVPALLRFRAGYIQGAKYTNPDITILETELGNYPDVWQNTKRAEDAAANLIEQKADILFAAAGQAGIGVLQKAAQNQIYAIGVDTNQNKLFPGTMIGSIIKNTNKAVYITLFQVCVQNILNNTPKKLGLLQNAINIDFDGVKNGLVPTAIQQKINNIKTEILQNKIKIAAKI